MGCDTPSCSCDKLSLKRDVGQDNSLSDGESPATLGAGVSNEQIAGAKANDDSTFERDQARSVPDS